MMTPSIDLIILAVVLIALAFLLGSACYVRPDRDRLFGLAWGLFVGGLSLLALIAAVSWGIG